MEVMVMTAATDTAFTELRLGKVVGISSGDQEEPSFFVVLDGTADDVHLPILIGGTEAVSLAAALGGTQFARPMSPQFAAGLLRALGGRLREVRIDRLVDVRGGTAYAATAEIEGPSGPALVDARASDALNLAALCPAPILVAAEVLASAQAALMGDDDEGRCLRQAVDAPPMTMRPAGE
jgi:bifunctional DNase/RNase